MNTAFETLVTTTAILAARTAGAAIRDAFLAAEGGAKIAIENKTSYADIVTEVDREAEGIIGRLIFEGVPQSRILGEEQGWQGASDEAVTWYVDPIDGTSNFASGLPIFCVSIAAFTNYGRPLCGVIFDPMRDEMFVASGGELTLNGVRLGLNVRARSDRDAELLTNLPREGKYPTSSELETFARLVEAFRAVRRIGSSALQLAYVAVGRAAIGYDEGCGPWDIAAGLSLVQASGGQIVAWNENGEWLPAPLTNPAAISKLVVANAHFDIENSSVLGSGNERLRVRGGA
ncbi:inositol monophosphatase family protein [Ochrobactrum sp. Marseille-Q0166]|uniref:inositol monophosphatase family protein n=1 Tax=Ochrobactrum sp. Marseille-Q0166 TaxID=2761105 RepID=UPI001654D65C|nr:inositol monophosphatase family protein [Ochrobactrum sp. Marseille-Q0166]MBC8716382.1 inositol monophosphatase [Ochrobactrum sp. Marseille-Q0166]